MLKVFGMVLVFISVSGLGFKLSFALAERIKRLESIKRLINEFMADLRFKKTPVSDFFDKLKKDGSHKYISLFSGTAASEKNLSNDEKFILNEFRNIIGSTNSETQINLLRELGIKTDEFIKKAKLEQEEKSKLFSTGGVLVGILIVILIV